ncbi:hypothetical protein CQW23_25783 [Capsicum baccatum]|uniref:Retrovirus-related Pol polyprotein from transposon TNT 1-94 n=1 Tax=Capsicum baccatum TaxID=33114 RepID=A0A2G2VLY3_CAPBA|nr:hypothetical protein CQW23_25783 [Capsicum baccatum]
MNLNEKLQQEDGTGQANSRSFRSMVGGLIYLSHIYSDISYSVGVVSRFMSNPSKHHFRAAKRILHYIAGTLEHACQCIWLRRILADLNQKQEKEMEIYCDNKSTIAMTKNPAFHRRTKHIDIRFHFIRELVEKEEIMMKFWNTNEQVADIFTKALPYKKHVYFKSLFDVSDFESGGNVE